MYVKQVLVCTTVLPQISINCFLLIYTQISLSDELLSWLINSVKKILLHMLAIASYLINITFEVHCTCALFYAVS